MTMILPVTEDDVPMLAAIHEDAFGLHAWSAAMLADSLKNQDVWGVKLLADYGALGFALCQQTGEDCEILTFAVLPARQHRGHGQRLLQAVIESAQVRQSSQILLEVAADNRAARKFYDFAGFFRTGERPGYYPRPAGAISAILMALKLPERREA